MMFELDCRTEQPESMRGITRYQFSSELFFSFLLLLFICLFLFYSMPQLRARHLKTSVTMT